MATFWESDIIRNTAAGRSQGSWQLASLGTAERLVRVVLQGYIDLRTGESAQIEQWIRHGVLSLIEITYGSPPPAPAPVSTGDYDTRDIVFSDYQQLGFAGVLTNTYAVPVAPARIDIDVAVRRGDGVQEVGVWWVWGLPSTVVAGVNVGFERAWYRVLVDQV